MMNNTDSVGFSKNGTEPTIVDYILAIAYSVLLLLSLVGNILIQLVINRNSVLHTSMNYIIANMSISNLVFTLFVIPSIRIAVIFIRAGNWLISGMMGEIFCKTIPFVTDASIIVSVLSLELVSFLRLCAVVFPFKRQALQSRKSCFIAIFLIWTFATIYSSPNLYFWQISTVNNTTICKQNLGSSGQKIELIIFQTFFSIIPALTLAAMYTVTIYFIRKNPRDQHLGSLQVKRMKRDSKRVTYMLLTVVVLFLVPSTAVCIFLFLFQFKCVDGDAARDDCRDVKNTKVIYVLLVLSYLSQAFTPYVYFFFNPRYRRGARLLCYCKNKDSPVRNKEEPMVIMAASASPNNKSIYKTNN